MRPLLPLALCTVLVVTGCARVAESRFNPLNWFGASQPVAVDPANRRPLVTSDMVTQVVDGRVLIDQITALEIVRAADGAIIRATGIASTQGQFNAQLVPVARDGGRLTLAFRVEVPQGFQAQGSSASRQITVARALSANDLAGVRTITVQAARNARVVSR